MHRHRQLHLWITEHDYSLLRELADERGETLSSVIRRLIKLHRPGPAFGNREVPDVRSYADFWPL
jgi:hypothetical protein